MASCVGLVGQCQKFFVTVRNDVGRVGWLLGPYEEHTEAVANVDRGRNLAEKADPWSSFYAFGTAGVRDGYWAKVKPVFGK